MTPEQRDQMLEHRKNEDGDRKHKDKDKGGRHDDDRED